MQMISDTYVVVALLVLRSLVVARILREGTVVPARLRQLRVRSILWVRLVLLAY
jgi:hypothetical protein